MRVFRLLLPLLLVASAAAAQQPAPPPDAAPLPVLGFKWTKSTRTPPKGEGASTGPAAARQAKQAHQRPGGRARPARRHRGRAQRRD